jgi:tetratricopeptide (TPR) repeat protein
VDFAKEVNELKERVNLLKTQNHFEVLGLTPQSDPAGVKVAYFKMAKVYHPDTVVPGSPPELAKLKGDIFSRVGEAYRVLNDAKSRQDYLDELKSGQSGDKVDINTLLAAEETFTKGTLFIKNRRFPEALKLLEEAIRMNPEEGEFYAWRGYARYFTNPDKQVGAREATLDITKALSMTERCAPAHYFLGHIAKMSGNNEKALTHFKKAVEISPDHIDAQREVRLLTSRKTPT